MNEPRVGMYWRMVFLVILGIFPGIYAQEDPGRTTLGSTRVTVYFGTNGDPDAAGERAEEISEATRYQLISQENLKYESYRAMGADTQPVFRSYENWAQPLKPSDEVLVRFETRKQPTAHEISLNLELWLARKKILKTDVMLVAGRPLFILGPDWRGGKLIVAVALAE